MHELARRSARVGAFGVPPLPTVTNDLSRRRGTLRRPHVTTSGGTTHASSQSRHPRRGRCTRRVRRGLRPGLGRRLPPHLSQGAFCAYSSTFEEGRLLLATQGNWSGTLTNVQSTFNNGYPDPGADHVQLGYTAGGVSYSTCIHYAPGGGQYAHQWNNITIKSVRWRGEC